MNDTHPDWPRISSGVYYVDAARAIDWLVEAFGFEVRLRIEGDGGVIEHSELTLNGGLVMVGSTGRGNRPDRAHCRSPKQVGGVNTQALCVYVADPDAHCARARAAGADIVREPTTDDYGEEYGAHRTYEAVDPEGHHWFFLHIVRDPKER
jgi:uncharacterized glyoxalase superfamily protein PhnB